MSNLLKAAFALCLVIASTAAVLAAAADREMVYRGYLEQNGAPVNGTRVLRFQFHSAASGNTALGSAITVNNVNVSAGNFSATLSVPDAALASSTLFLAVEVGTASNNLVALSNTRQRIFSTPLAMRGRFDTAFVVDGSANIRGTELALGTASPGTTPQQRALTVGAGDTLIVNNSGDFEGGVRVDGAVSVGNTLTVGNTTTAGSRTLAFTRDNGDESNAGKIGYKGFGEADSLSIIGAGATTNDRKISLWDDVTVKGDLTVNGRMASKTASLCDCEDASESVSPANVVANVGEGNNLVQPTFRYQCRGNRVLSGFTSGGVCNMEAFAVAACLRTFRCCRPCNLDPL